MKKLTVLLILSVIFYSNSHGQFNPVNDLNWDQWYECPNNYFILTWTVPTTSQDTLIGYNIYRNNELYRFQTETILNHQPFGVGNCAEDFLLFDTINDFWIHVNAIYNSDSIESNYNDSVWCSGFAISINEININRQTIYPNPASEKLNIDISGITMIKLTDTDGKVIKSTFDKSELDLSNFSNGLYFVKVIADNKEYNYKIVIDK